MDFKYQNIKTGQIKSEEDLIEDFHKYINDSYPEVNMFGRWYKPSDVLVSISVDDHNEEFESFVESEGFERYK